MYLPASFSSSSYISDRVKFNLSVRFLLASTLFPHQLTLIKSLNYPLIRSKIATVRQYSYSCVQLQNWKRLILFLLLSYFLISTVFSFSRAAETDSSDQPNDWNLFPIFCMQFRCFSPLSTLFILWDSFFIRKEIAEADSLILHSVFSGTFYNNRYSNTRISMFWLNYWVFSFLCPPVHVCVVTFSFQWYFLQ